MIITHFNCVSEIEKLGLSNGAKFSLLKIIGSFLFGGDKVNVYEDDFQEFLENKVCFQKGNKLYRLVWKYSEAYLEQVGNSESSDPILIEDKREFVTIKHPTRDTNTMGAVLKFQGGHNLVIGDMSNESPLIIEAFCAPEIIEKISGMEGFEVKIKYRR